MDRSFRGLATIGAVKHFTGGLTLPLLFLPHGVTNHSSDLIYRNESGALNEAISDIMGVATEFFFQPVGDGRLQADWVIDEDTFIKGLITID